MLIEQIINCFQILDICANSKERSHLSRKQFYGALKLVAVHQAGLEIREDMVKSSLDVIALPRFTWPAPGDEDNNGRTKDSIRTVKSKSSNRLPDSTTESESEAESLRDAGIPC